MKKILIINPYYYPGYRSGGPQQTFMNIVEAYGDKYNFFILTLNHDLGCKKIYSNIHDEWNIVGKAKVKYVSEGEYTVSFISKLANEMDLVYAGGLFEKTTIIAMAANRLNKIHCPFWIAPMGVFSEGAIQQKKIKKKMFITLGNIIGLFNNIMWSFTSELELKDFNLYMKSPKIYEIASDIPRKSNIEISHKIKEKGNLKIIFLSRICHKKNLAYAIDIIGKLNGNIIFDIYGTKESKDYWELCEKKLSELPSNIQWAYNGEVEGSKTISVFSQYDIFLFPTLGENFGHVIFEALAAGCVPVISDTTPWTDFEKKKCGYIVSLDNKKEFISLIQNLVDANSDCMSEMSKNAFNESKTIYENSVINNGYIRIFDNY